MNPRCRTRGFVFLLVGVACAHLGRQNTLHIYENGAGAINLPFRESEVGVDQSQAVHPLSLRDASDFVSHYLGMPFALTNPFLFRTKTQMCEALVRAGATDLIFDTVSCDRRLRQRGQPMQCGRCSSCLLRRQALAVLGIEDRTAYAVTEAAHHSRPVRPADGDFLRVMLYQVETLERILKTANPWQSLCGEHVDFVDIVDRVAGNDEAAASIMQKRLLDLYRQYVAEWRVAEPFLRRGLLGEGMTRTAATISYRPVRGDDYGIKHSQYHRYAGLGAETAGSPQI